MGVADVRVALAGRHPEVRRPRIEDDVDRLGGVADPHGADVPGEKTEEGEEEDGEEMRIKALTTRPSCRGGLFVAQHALHGYQCPPPLQAYRLRGNSAGGSTPRQAGALQQASRKTPQ